MYVPGRGCQVPSQDSAIRTDGTCVEAQELADLGAPRSTASRNFYYPCCFGATAWLAADPGGVGSFPAGAEISRADTTS
jgi:hypothetical protein